VELVPGIIIFFTGTVVLFATV